MTKLELEHKIKIISQQPPYARNQGITVYMKQEQERMRKWRELEKELEMMKSLEEIKRWA